MAPARPLYCSAALLLLVLRSELAGGVYVKFETAGDVNMDMDRFHSEELPANWGKDLNFTFIVDDNNVPIVYMRFNGEPANYSIMDVRSKTGERPTRFTLSILRPTVKSSGNYTFEVIKPGFGSGEVVVKNVTVPPVVDFHKGQFAMLVPIDADANKPKKFDQGSVKLLEGSKVVLRCGVYGYPLPSIVWFEKESPNGPPEPFNKTRGGRHLSEIRLANHVESSVTIYAIDGNDQAYYECFASNKFDNVTVRMLLRVKSTFAWLYPTIGIIVVFLLLVLVIFAFEFVQRRKDRKLTAEKEN